MDGKSKTKTHKGQRLNLELGTKLLVTLEDHGTPIKALLTGMEPDAYLVIRLPEATVVSDNLGEESHLKIRYVSWGDVYGFKSKIIGHFYKDDILLLIISYPGRIKSFDMRKEERIESYIPAKLTLAGEHYHGCVMDLSPNGCRFDYNKKSKKHRHDFSHNDKVQLSFKLPGQDQAQLFAGLINDIRKDEPTLSLVIKFDLDAGASFSTQEILSYMEEHRSHLEH